MPKSEIHQEIDALSRLVEAAMKRAHHPQPRSLIRQLSGMIRFCLRHHVAGNVAHPGVARIAKMGDCRERMAQRNLRILENWGVLHVAPKPDGGGFATRYVLDLNAVARVLITLQCNISDGAIGRIAALAEVAQKRLAGVHFYTHYDVASVHPNNSNIPVDVFLSEETETAGNA